MISYIVTNIVCFAIDLVYNCLGHSNYVVGGSCSVVVGIVVVDVIVGDIVITPMMMMMMMMIMMMMALVVLIYN